MSITEKKSNRKPNLPTGFRKVTRKVETEKENEAPSTIKKVICPQQNEVSLELKSERPQIRYLKLKPFIRESRAKALHRPPSTVVPELRLCGNWLEKAGFLPCSYVSVTVMDELLIIRSSKEQDSN